MGPAGPGDLQAMWFIQSFTWPLGSPHWVWDAGYHRIKATHGGIIPGSISHGHSATGIRPSPLPLYILGPEALSVSECVYSFSLLITPQVVALTPALCQPGRALLPGPLHTHLEENPGRPVGAGGRPSPRAVELRFLHIEPLTSCYSSQG